MPHQAADLRAADSHPLVIIGASARSLAQSATAAGWQVHAADLFADLDLHEAARSVIRAAEAGSGYPRNLIVAADSFPPAAWCYTGALENHPDLVGDLATRRPLAGNGPDAIRAVRDPLRLAAATRAAGLLFPETRTERESVPGDGSFLVKPIASAAGRGISRWTADVAARYRSSPARHVWQRYIAGVPHSAAFAVGGGAARLLGFARQLIGGPWCHAGGFTFCGGVAVPASAISPGIAAQLSQLGAMLAQDVPLVGALGVDLVVDDEHRLWVIEVNPRPTASMELHERTTGESIAAAHLGACGFPSAGSRSPLPVIRDGVWAKAVLHAPHAIDVSADRVARWLAQAAAWTADDGGWPALADVPAPQQTIPAGAPLLTVFAQGHTDGAAVAAVTLRATAILALLSRPSAAASALQHPAMRIA